MNTAQPLPALLSMSSVDHIRERFETLKQSDAQFRDALPLASVAETKCRPELGLAQVVATCLEAYAARPALAERATRWVTDPATGRKLSAQERLSEIRRAARLADEAGLDVFGLGEHHRLDFAVSSPVVALATMAAETRRIRLSTAVTVLSAADPPPVQKA